MIIFFFKNISMSTFSGSSWDLLELTMSHTVEKTLSSSTVGSYGNAHCLFQYLFNLGFRLFREVQDYSASKVGV